MKIATYNIWDSDRGMPARLGHLATAYAETHGTHAAATLNFRENPRWGAGEANTMELNQRFDWILCKNPYPTALPVLRNCALFGTGVFGETHLAASDHYGVVAELTF